MKKGIVLSMLMAVSLLTVVSCMKKDDVNPQSGKRAAVHFRSTENLYADTVFMGPVSISSNDEALAGFIQSDDYADYNAEEQGMPDLNNVTLADTDNPSLKSLGIPIIMVNSESELHMKEIITFFDAMNYNRYNSVLVERYHDKASDKSFISFSYTDGTLMWKKEYNGNTLVSTTGPGANPGKPTWCMKAGVTACANSWKCSVLCGIAFQQCVGSMAVACLYVSTI